VSAGPLAEGLEPPRREPRWLTGVQVRMLHAETIRLFGGLGGVRDEGLLESALARARNLRAYREPSPFELAAAYGFGLARNHPFVDGNKRVALLAVRAFLFTNGYRFAPDQVGTVTTMEGVASGRVDEAALAAWIERNSTPAKP